VCTEQVQTTLGLFDQLLSLYSQVASSSQALSGSTQKLLNEKTAITGEPGLGQQQLHDYHCSHL